MYVTDGQQQEITISLTFTNCSVTFLLIFRMSHKFFIRSLENVKKRTSIVKAKPESESFLADHPRAKDHG